MSTDLMRLAQQLVKATTTGTAPQVSQAYRALEAFVNDPDKVATEAEVQRAMNKYCNDGIDIDTPALVSRGDEGLWISAWVWLPELEVQDAG